MNNELKIDPKLIPSILSGKKKATIRSGRRSFNKGPGCFVDSTNSNLKLHIDVQNVEFVKLKNVTEDMLLCEGYKSVNELHSALSKYYPEINLESDVTYIEFKLVRSSTSEEFPSELKSKITSINSFKTK